MKAIVTYRDVFAATPLTKTLESRSKLDTDLDDQGFVTITTDTEEFTVAREYVISITKEDL